MPRVTDLASFQNRLAKNWRHLERWAAREQVFAYRVYDCDVPEFPVIADWYGTESGAWLHLQELETGWQQSPAEHEQWLTFVSEVSAEVLGLTADRVVQKTRARQRVRADRTQQYGRLGTDAADLIVREGSHRFWINLEAYLDTGLFLDHRKARALIGARALGRRFLNLFAYTGSFTVYAAGAGASASTTVDLSNTYCAWAARNFELNGIDMSRHAVERADARAWLVDAQRRRERFELIVLDPPSFSNSKKMDGVLDVQRDHVELIRQCQALLASGGELFFSTNLRSFELDAALAREPGCKEISRRTIPPDFRDQRIHRAWLIQG
jgi:23S rRNA (cytosine1962-C5)-methyltransferase